MNGASLGTVQVDLEPGWRGGQRQVLLLCCGLARRGHPVVLAARAGGELARRARGEGIRVVELPGGGEVDPRVVLGLVRTVRAVRPQLVVVHSSRSHGVGALAGLLLGRNRPPLLVTRRVAFPPGRDPLNRWKYRRAVDGYIAISRAAADALRRAGVPRDRVRIVHSGVQPPDPCPSARDSVREELGVGGETHLVVAVGGLTSEKGHGDLIAAWPRVLEKVPDAKLAIVGDGPLMGELRRTAAGCGLGDDVVRFLGHREDPVRFIAAADVLVHPSLMEGLGTVILDAMMLSVPVVASAVGGIPEAVEDRVTGLLVPPRDRDGLAAAVAVLLTDPVLASRLAAEAKRRAEARFTADAMVEGTLEAYRGFLHARHPRRAARLCGDLEGRASRPTDTPGGGRS